MSHSHLYLQPRWSKENIHIPVIVPAVSTELRHSAPLGLIVFLVLAVVFFILCSTLICSDAVVPVQDPEMYIIAQARYMQVVCRSEARA